MNRENRRYTLDAQLSCVRRELALRKRPWTGARAPGSGLTLMEVLYPPELDPFR